MKYKIQLLCDGNQIQSTLNVFKYVGLFDVFQILRTLLSEYAQLTRVIIKFKWRIWTSTVCSP